MIDSFAGQGIGFVSVDSLTYSGKRLRPLRHAFQGRCVSASWAHFAGAFTILGVGSFDCSFTIP